MNSYQHYLIILGYLSSKHLDSNACVLESLHSLLELAQLGENPYRRQNEDKEKK